VHVPCAEHSRTARQLFWFHDVLHCIEQQNPAAGQVHDEMVANLGDADLFSESVLTAECVEESRQKVETLQCIIQNGRDALLEMNSCRQPFADELADKITLFEQETPLELIEMASDLLNFHFEAAQEGVFSLIPSDKMMIPSLPAIPLEGTELTFSRELANRREDLQFLTWDSPFIIGLWELLHHSDLGAASVATLPSKQLPAGHCLLEVCFDLVVQSRLSAVCLPFLTDHSVRTLVLDISDKNLAALLPEDALQRNIQPVKKHLARDVVKSRKQEIDGWYKKAEELAEVERQQLIDTAVERAEHYYQAEITRLQNLARHHSAADTESLALLNQRSQQVTKALLENTHMQLSAIRLIVVT